jgi:hypothetical protein
MRPLVIFLFYTGARLSEALYLSWREVDLASKQVRFLDTKNGTDRGVPLHARVVAPVDPLMDGGKLTSLGLYPTVAVASDGSVSLLGIVERDGEEANAVLRYGLAPTNPR